MAALSLTMHHFNVLVLACVAGVCASGSATFLTSRIDRLGGAPRTPIASSTSYEDQTTIDARHDAPQDIVGMLDAMPMLEDVKELLAGLPTEDLTTALATICNSDDLLENFDNISDIMAANTSTMVSGVLTQLNRVSLTTREATPIENVHILQDFFRFLVHNEAEAEKTCYVVADRVMELMPPNATDCLRPVASQLSSRLGLPLMKYHLDLQGLIHAPVENFCQAAASIVKETNLLEVRFAEKALLAQNIRRMIPSFIGSFLAPERVPKVQNVTQRVAEVMAQQFSSLAKVGRVLVAVIGSFLTERLRCL